MFNKKNLNKIKFKKLQNHVKKNVLKFMLNINILKSLKIN